MRTAAKSFIFIIVLFSAVVSAQEFINPEPVQISYDAVATDSPTVVYNGRDYAVFFSWKGKADYELGVHMRRLDEEGNPIGPQVKIEGIESEYLHFLKAAWDGEAYILAYSESYVPILISAPNAIWRKGGPTWINVLRVSPEGKLLKKRKVPLNVYALFMRSSQLFVIGDKVFLFFNYYDDLDKWGTFELIGDRNLGKRPSLERLPVDDLGSFPNFLGAGLEADKFLLLFALEKSLFDYWEIYKTFLLQVDFNGEVIKPPYDLPLSQLGAGVETPPGATLIGPGIQWLSNPVFVGDGFVLAVSSFSMQLAPEESGASLPYNFQSFKIDEDGNLLSGPFNLGFPAHPFPGSYNAKLVGNHVALFSDAGFGISLFLLGRKGGHIGTLPVDEEFFGLLRIGYEEIGADHAYSGVDNLIVWEKWLFPLNGVKEEKGVAPTSTIPTGPDRVMSNKYSMPDFTKPGFFYFKAGTAEPVEDHRLVIWSVVGGRNVTLTGPDFELEDLPPVWHYLVDTKGQKTKLTLSFTTEDGQTKSRKLIIKP
jgi:hypothetical protein